MNNKKIIIIACVVLILLVATSYLLSNLFSKRNQNRPKPENSSITNPIEIISDVKEKMYYPEIVAEQNAIYYLGDQGIRLKKYSLIDKTVTSLYDQELYFVQNLKISPTGKRALILTRDNQDYIYKILNLEAKTLTDFRKDAFDADWLSDNQVIFSTTFNDQTELATTSDDGKTIQPLITLPFSLPVIQLSPDSKKAIVYPEPEGFGQNTTYLFNIESKKLDKLPEKYNLVGARWSTDSQKIVSPEIDQNGESVALVVTNVQTLNQAKFILSTNLDKIIWIDDNRFFAALKVKNQSDKLLIVDQTNNNISTLNYNFSNPYGSTGLDVHNLMLKDKTIFFTSDDYLYSLNLP